MCISFLAVAHPSFSLFVYPSLFLFLSHYLILSLKMSFFLFLVVCIFHYELDPPRIIFMRFLVLISLYQYSLFTTRHILKDNIYNLMQIITITFFEFISYFRLNLFVMKIPRASYASLPNKSEYWKLLYWFRVLVSPLCDFHPGEEAR